MLFCKGGVSLDLPVGGCGRVPALPVYAGDQPTPLRCSEGKNRVAGARPGEVATVQPALRQPDAGAVPNQQFEPAAAPVGKGVGGAVTGGAPETGLDAGRQAINAQAHVHRFDDQPD